MLAVLTAGLVFVANLSLAAPMITGLGVLGLLVDVVVAAGLVPALGLAESAGLYDLLDTLTVGSPHATAKVA